MNIIKYKKMKKIDLKPCTVIITLNLKVLNIQIFKILSEYFEYKTQPYATSSDSTKI